MRRLEPAPKPRDVLSHAELCVFEGLSLQQGMNFRTRTRTWSTLLMSVRTGAPYRDQIVDDYRTLLYEGHDQRGSSRKKAEDQPEFTETGALTQNGKFHKAAQATREGKSPPEPVRVFEKIRKGLWVYTGNFHLLDSWRLHDGVRQVFKFKLSVVDELTQAAAPMQHTRIIPPAIIREVWERDGGKCTICGERDNLHFDHIIPFSKGGSSLTGQNVQLLCARHNIIKGASVGDEP